MINIDTPVGPFRTNTIMFQDVIMALEYNVLAPMQRGELFYRKNALPFGQHKAVKGQTFVLQLVDDFIEGTCEIANAQPHNTMLRQILAVIRGEPRDEGALVDIFCAATRATARVQDSANTQAQIMRALTLLDQLMQHYGKAFNLFPDSRYPKPYWCSYLKGWSLVSYYCE